MEITFVNAIEELKRKIEDKEFSSDHCNNPFCFIMDGKCGICPIYNYDGCLDIEEETKEIIEEKGIDEYEAREEAVKAVEEMLLSTCMDEKFKKKCEIYDEVINACKIKEYEDSDEFEIDFDKLEEMIMGK